MQRPIQFIAAILLTFPLFLGQGRAQQSPPNPSLSAAAPQTTWTIDKIHSHIGFSVAHFRIVQVTGYFRDFDATVHCTCPAGDFTGGTVVFTAKTASIFTDNEQRDAHLKSDDFFNAARFPEMKFTGALVNQDGNSKLKGSLTIRDITRPVSFDVTFGGRIQDKNFAIEKAGFKVTGVINRLDYGLKWNETFEGGGAIVGNEVTLDLNIEIDKQIHAPSTNP